VRIDVGKGYEFVPKWNNNRDDDEPVKIHCRYLTTEERNRYTRLDAGEQTMADYQGMVRAAVERIENLAVDGDKIESARDLLDAKGLGGLFSELCIDIVRQNGADASFLNGSG